MGNMVKAIKVLIRLVKKYWRPLATLFGGVAISLAGFITGSNAQKKVDEKELEKLRAATRKNEARLKVQERRR